MKTRVRITKKNPEFNTYDGKQYQELFFNFLIPLYKDERYLKIAFSMKWLGYEGHDDWFGGRFIIETDNSNHIAHMLKIANILEQKCGYRIHPLDVFSYLDAEEYVYDNGNFIPLSYNGFNVYEMYHHDLVTDSPAINENPHMIIYAKKDRYAYGQCLKEVKKRPSYFPGGFRYKMIRENIQIAKQDINLNV